MFSTGDSGAFEQSVTFYFPESKKYTLSALSGAVLTAEFMGDFGLTFDKYNITLTVEHKEMYTCAGTLPECTYVGKGVDGVALWKDELQSCSDPLDVRKDIGDRSQLTVGYIARGPAHTTWECPTKATFTLTLSPFFAVLDT